MIRPGAILNLYIVLIAVVAISVANSATAAVLVAPDSHSLQSQARDGNVQEDNDSFEDVDTITGLATFSQSASNGGSSTTADYVVLNDADGLYLGIDFSMVRAGTTQSMTQVIGGLNFTVTESTPYSIDGLLSTTTSDPPTYNGYNLYARLTDSNGTLFENLQSGGNLSSTEYLLGEEEGNFSNTLVGSSTGTLEPGEDYSLEYYAQVIQFNTVRSSDTAYGSGYWKIQLGSNSIPEPASVSLGITLLGVACLRLAMRTRLS